MILLETVILEEGLLPRPWLGSKVVPASCVAGDGVVVVVVAVVVVVVVVVEDDVVVGEAVVGEAVVGTGERVVVEALVVG